MSPAFASFVLNFSRVRLERRENLLPEGPDFGQGPGTVPRLSRDTVLWYRLVQVEDWPIPKGILERVCPAEREAGT